MSEPSSSHKDRELVISLVKSATKIVTRTVTFHISVDGNQQTLEYADKDLFDSASAFLRKMYSRKIYIESKKALEDIPERII